MDNWILVTCGAFVILAASLLGGSLSRSWSDLGARTSPSFMSLCAASQDLLDPTEKCDSRRSSRW